LKDPSNFDEPGPGFLTYFLVLSSMIIVGYILYHNKSKVISTKKKFIFLVKFKEKKKQFNS